jgi:hypothetical protein
LNHNTDNKYIEKYDWNTSFKLPEGIQSNEEEEHLVEEYNEEMKVQRIRPDLLC